MTGERTYVDVAAQGIQHYIGRTPKLKGLRGASARLSHATSAAEVEFFLAGSGLAAGIGAAVNPEAGEADGIVPVRFPAGPDPRRVAEQVAAYLREALPAIELDGVWGTGASYLEVYRDSMKSQRADPPLRSLPPVREFPPLETCAECRADPAAGTIDIHEERNVRVCLDCLQRYDDRYRRPTEVIRALGRDPMADTARDSNDLARLGGEGTNRNHIAIMYADGNAIGAFFDRVIAHGDPGLKERISAGVSDATRAALREATRAVAGPGAGTALPVVPHVVGGDDLIVSLTADRAWPFTMAYLREFRDRVARIDGLPPGLLEPVPPSASAGLVFAHSKFPFRRAAELAADQLKAAKQRYHGAEPAVAWLDVTRDGEHPPAGQRPWRLDDLTGLAGALSALREKVQPSGLAVLARLADPGRPELALARITEHARRLEREAVLTPFLGSGGPAADAERIAGALSLARWWR